MFYLLDTNAVIDLLNGNKNITAKIEELIDDCEIKIPDIAYYEVLRGFKYKDEKNQLPIFEKFCESFGIEYMSLKTLELAATIWANLRKSGLKMDDDDDLLIGSLTIERDAVLVTNNTKHFERMKNIKLTNWAFG